MLVSFGFKAHSGWAALAVVGKNEAGTPLLVDRRRIELVEEQWAKQPYHAAEGMDVKPAEGRCEVHPEGVQEVVADKGYHSNEVLVGLAELEVRSYIAEPDRGPRN